MPDAFDNPYAAPQVASDPILAGDASADDAEVIRRKYLGHEMSVKSIGTLYYLGGVFTAIAFLVAFAGLVTAITASRNSMGPTEAGFLAGIVALYGVLTFLSFYLGRGLRALNPKVRTPAGIMAALGLLAIPIGTLINGYILYLLFSQKGKMVFSPEYREIIELTPHVRYKTSLIAWLALLLIILLVVGLIVFASLSG